MGMRYRRSAGPLTGEFYDEVRQTLNANWQSTHWHKSWDWLMPVVEKIETMDGIRFIIEKNRVLVCAISGDEYYWNSGTTYDTKLQTTYNAVVEFIKWYNENKS